MTGVDERTLLFRVYYFILALVPVSPGRAYAYYAALRRALLFCAAAARTS